MFKPGTVHIPEHHPVRTLFRELAERGLSQRDIHDEASVRYVAQVMVDFIDMDRVYPVAESGGPRLEYLTDLIAEAHRASEPDSRRDHFQHLGDLTLFMLGLFPERFLRSRRALSPEFYAAEGRRSYRIVAEMVRAPSELAVFHRLSDEYDHYVEGLQWVRLYIRDPFFQYMFREFGISGAPGQ
jgi:hypothetical protein